MEQKITNPCVFLVVNINKLTIMKFQFCISIFACCMFTQKINCKNIYHVTSTKGRFQLNFLLQ